MLLNSRVEISCDMIECCVERIQSWKGLFLLDQLKDQNKNKFIWTIGYSPYRMGPTIWSIMSGMHASFKNQREPKRYL